MGLLVGIKPAGSARWVIAGRKGCKKQEISRLGNVWIPSSEVGALGIVSCLVRPHIGENCIEHCQRAWLLCDM